MAMDTVEYILYLENVTPQLYVISAVDGGA